jgi:hypothetical protein
MDTPQEAEQQPNIVIPTAPTLRIMATFLPYICILALAAVIVVMYKDQRADKKEIIETLQRVIVEKDNDKKSWQDGFLGTVEVFKKIPALNYDNSSQDSNSSSVRSVSGKRR